MARIWLAIALTAGIVLIVARGMPVVTPLAMIAGVAAMAALLGIAIVPLRWTQPWERATVSLALVFAAFVLGGLALSTAGLPLTAWNWLGVMAVLVAFTGAIALRERVRPRSRRRIVPAGVWLLAALAAAQVALAGGLSVAGALTGPQTPFTQLTLSQSAAGEVVVGLENHEGSGGQYRVVVRVDGEDAEVWPALQVPRGERWTRVVTLPATWQNVSAYVYRPPDAATPTLRTVIWNRDRE